jgi:DNA repair ATPase RecN
MAKMEEEVEIIPVSPLRRLEKRLEQLETSSTFNDKEFYRELVDIIRLNQQLVDELAKSNDALRIELSRIPSRLEELTMRLNELLTYIKAATEEPAVAGESHLGSKLDQLVEMNKKMVETNQSIVSALEEVERKLRKPAPPLPMFRKPLPKLAVQP